MAIQFRTTGSAAQAYNPVRDTAGRFSPTGKIPASAVGTINLILNHEGSIVSPVAESKMESPTIECDCGECSSGTLHLGLDVSSEEVEDEPEIIHCDGCDVAFEYNFDRYFANLCENCASAHPANGR
jgi:hypothetical protein